MSRSVAEPLRGKAVPLARAASRAASFVPGREAPVMPLFFSDPAGEGCRFVFLKSITECAPIQISAWAHLQPERADRA